MRVKHEIASWGLGDAYVSHKDLKNEKYVIYLGGNLEFCEHVFKTDPTRIRFEPVLEYPSYSMYLESNIENIISHETTHLSIYKQTHDFDAVDKFDDIERADCCVSGFVPYDSSI